MTGPRAAATEFDLQPDPRILPMLGEITLPQWRCLAEFIDNSVDAFLSAKRSGHPVPEPEIHITVPTADSARGRVAVRDNGPGMDVATLEKAVRAGWTSNDPINNLGMFGMGFNIATARLGSVTQVWTTRRGDTEWCGLEIDFDKLVQQRHFRTPRLTRPKADALEQGTELTIERLKPEQRQWLGKTANRSRLVREFESMYAAMLRPNGVPISFRLLLNGTALRGRSHCVWGGEGNPAREVLTARFGTVSAYQSLNVELPTRSFCVKCWQWLPSDATTCPACDSADNVVARQRRVYGWIGLQRYVSDVDYGIDFIRNGRKIESANKDLFFWDAGGSVEPEYPVDDPRGRGRLVGEIHIDHCRVTYTKDRFDRNDPAWEEMVHLVRGAGPLRPDRAAELGFPQNDAPLFLLFQVFRRNSPKSKVAGAYEKLMIVRDNDDAARMAKRFYAGEAEFQTDQKWWDLVIEADRELLVPKSTPPTGGDSGGGTLPGFGGKPTATPGAAPVPPPAAGPPPPPRSAIPSLSREYRDSSSGQRWETKAYRVQADDPVLGTIAVPWVIKATPAGIHEFFVNPGHGAFRSATLTPLDALLAEFAHSAMDFLRNRQTTATFASVLAALRDEYAGTEKLDHVALSGEASMLLGAIARSVGQSSSAAGDGRALFNELTPIEQEAVFSKMAERSVSSSQKEIAEGRFLEYAPRATLLRFVERHPELFFDGRYWDAPYSSIDYERPAATEAARARTVEYHVGLMRDVLWLAEQDIAELEAASRPRLLRAALALDLLSGEPAEDTTT